MKRSSQLFTFFAVLIAISALYRVIPFESRPVWLGAPQLALALFAGSVIKNRKWAFAVPLISLLVSDILMQILHSAGITPGYPGFYEGQIFNYVLITLLTVVGFFVNSRKVISIVSGMFAAPTLFFLVSNFGVWAANGGLQRAKTFTGLMQCYADGIPFYGYSLLTMVVFGALLFGGYALFAGSPVARKVKA
jgi:hypothetical protein